MTKFFGKCAISKTFRRIVLEPIDRLWHSVTWSCSNGTLDPRPSMDRSSKAITLALIGSAFLFAGCQNNEEEQNQNQQNAGGGGRGVFIAPRIGGGYGGGGRAGGGVSSAPSARGGFGSTGATGSVGVGS